MTKLISEMTPAEVRLMRIQGRRERNAIARRLGFNNYAEWQGEGEDEA